MPSATADSFLGRRHEIMAVSIYNGKHRPIGRREIITLHPSGKAILRFGLHSYVLANPSVAAVSTIGEPQRPAAAVKLHCVKRHGNLRIWIIAPAESRI